MLGTSRAPDGEILSFGPFHLTVAARLLVRDEVPIAIGGRALDILIVLAQRAGQVVSRRELVDLVWPDVVVEEANLRVHVAALRKVLEDGRNGARYIVNIPGRGYSFVAPVRRFGPYRTPAAAARAGVGAGPQGLPALPQLLVGRDETVVALASLLKSRRFVSVIGPGGIGKTTVAVAVAHALRREFGDDAICFVDLVSLTEPALVSSALASALGCHVQGSDPETWMLAFLADKRMLIVLDNCEHLIEAAAPLTERLFHAAPSVHLLTTSREALRVEGENVHLLSALDSPLHDTPSAAQALASPAVQLFMERAAASGHRVELSDLDAPVVAGICRRLDGIALAIELVASRVGTYGLRGTADLLDSGAELLLPGRRRALPRHQTLQAMLDWSFKLLPADEQNTFRRLSVFVGPFTLEAAQSVAGESESETQAVTNALASLVDKSLVWVSSASVPASHRLLDTTRAYAAAKLAESGEEEATERRHARHFAALLEPDRTEASLPHGRDTAAYAPHMGNVRKALAWCFSGSGDLSTGVALASRAAPLFLGLSLLAECQRWCRQALGALSEADRGTLLELELQEAMAVSSMYTRGNTGEVRAAIERGLALSESLAELRHQLHLLSGLNLFLTRLGDFSGGLAVAQRGFAVARESGGVAEGVMTEWMLAASYHITGDQAAALHHCRRGFKLVSDVDLAQVNFFGFDHRLRGLITLARCLWLNGFPDQGCRTARQSIDEAERYDHPVLRCIALLNCIPVLLWSADLEEAARHADVAIDQAERYSLAPYLAAGLALKGEIMVARGDAASGVEVLREALEALQANQHHVVLFPTSRALAEGLTRSGRPEEALLTIDKVVVQAEQTTETFSMPDLLRARGEILLALPRPDLAAAEESLLRSLDYARKQSALGWELRAAIPLARLWDEQGRTGAARAMLDGVYGRFTEGFGTRDLAAARQLLDALGPTS